MWVALGRRRPSGDQKSPHSELYAPKRYLRCLATSYSTMETAQATFNEDADPPIGIFAKTSLSCLYA